VEHYRYDGHGNAVEKLTLSGGDTTDREFYPHTYDAQGRIATREDYDGDSLNSTLVFRYDSLGRLAAQVEYLPPWTLMDSTVYEYRPDGKVQGESHYRQYGGSPSELVFWEYRDWQVPLGARPRAARAGRGLAGSAGRAAFDPAGRRLPDRPAAVFRLAR
jgi:YD repeat-containing protein